MIPNANEWCLELLLLLEGYGARISHRNKEMWFDEKNATLLLDKVRDEQYGISVGDKVMIDGSLTCPFVRNDIAGFDDSAKFSERVFQVVAFFKINGRVGRHNLEGTFCALVSHGFVGQDKPYICRGQELGHEANKVNLYWVGCLEKPDFLNQTKAESEEAAGPVVQDFHRLRVGDTFVFVGGSNRYIVVDGVNGPKFAVPIQGDTRGIRLHPSEYARVWKIS